MIRQLRTWLILLGEVGNARKLGGQLDRLFRHFVLEELAGVGLFAYLREPRSYEQILDEFDFKDSDFTRSLFNTLVTEEQPMLVFNEDLYRLNSADGALPSLDSLIDRTASNVQNFTTMAKGLARNIIRRLRQQELEFVENFEEDGKQMLSKFDATLGGNIYTTIRNATFALLSDRERESLRGKRFLDLGCGTGRETAEIWLKYGGDIQLIGVDPVPGMITLAKERFPTYLKELAPNHPPLLEDNFPRFEVQDATRLPYPDNTFDAVFHAFVLHWTTDPAKAIAETVRVLKPGGVVFGTQPVKPVANQYFDLVVRTSENAFGFFYKDDLRRWYADQGVELEVITPMAIFRGFK